MFVLRALGSRPSTANTTGATSYYTPVCSPTPTEHFVHEPVQQNTISSIDTNSPRPEAASVVEPQVQNPEPSVEVAESANDTSPGPPMASSNMPQAQPYGGHNARLTAISQQPGPGPASDTSHAPTYSEAGHGKPVGYTGDVKMPLAQQPMPNVTTNGNLNGQSVLLSQNPGTFAAGPALSGPAPGSEVNQVLHDRAATAESALNELDLAKINKAEGQFALVAFVPRVILDVDDRRVVVPGKDAKKFSKILKNEAKAEEKVSTWLYNRHRACLSTTASPFMLHYSS